MLDGLMMKNEEGYDMNGGNEGGEVGIDRRAVSLPIRGGWV